MSREFFFSHILLSLPLIPTLNASGDGKNLKIQGHAKIPGFSWRVQISILVSQKQEGHNYTLHMLIFNLKKSILIHKVRNVM